ncbi:MAG: heme o synthase [Leptonema sp. (in: bacteria)]
MNLKIKSYYQLFKPGLAFNIVITEIPIFIHYQIQSFEVIFYTTLGTLFCAMSSFAYNQILERNKDKLMERTKHRYLVLNNDNLRITYIIASSLIGLGIFILGYFINFYTMLCALFAFLNYVFIYTIWLKPKYTANTLIGGLSGSIGPFIAETAILEKITEYGIFLFILLFLWQPPHFWALAIFRFEDYKKANFAMLPVKKGIPFTIKQMYLYLLLFMIVIIFAQIFGLAGFLFSLPTLAFTVYLMYKIYEFQKKQEIWMMREIFFLTILLNLFWHVCLLFNEIIKI